jgi:hypothetical protein
MNPGSMARRLPRNPVDEPDSQHSSGILSVHQPVADDGNGCLRAIRFGDCAGVRRHTGTLAVLVPAIINEPGVSVPIAAHLPAPTSAGAGR